MYSGTVHVSQALAIILIIHTHMYTHTRIYIHTCIHTHVYLDR